MTELGYHYFDWNVDSEDYNPITSEHQIYSNVVKQLGRRSIYIVLFHDFKENYKTANSLRSIIHYCKNKGYVLDKITMTTPMIHHHIFN